jgi:type IV pilus assembly protein PilB
MPVFEVMPITDEIRKLIINRADASIIKQKAQQEGVTFLIHDGIRRIKEGITTIDEVLTVSHSEEDALMIDEEDIEPAHSTKKKKKE